jgi:pyrroloquinoline quinone biosynthesis protein B
VRDAVVAYEVADGRGAGGVLFAPVFAAFDEPLRAAIERSSLAFLDGSFWSDDELSELGVPKPAQSLGHLPVGGTDGSLAALGELGHATRVGYAHVNNSSPLLDPASARADCRRKTPRSNAASIRATGRARTSRTWNARSG